MIEREFICPKCKRIRHVQFNPAPAYPESMLLYCLKTKKGDEKNQPRCSFVHVDNPAAKVERKKK